MQEDSYYSDYLNSKQGGTSIKEVPKSSDGIKKSIDELSERIARLADSDPANFNEKVKELISDEKVVELSYRHFNSRTLSELYLRPQEWRCLIDEWREDSAFKRDFDQLVSDDLIVIDGDDLSGAKLTELGVSVAKYCDNESMLFAQNKPEFFYGSGKSNRRKHAD